MLSNYKNKLLNNAKNLIGWRTSRKIVVFSVDDYGNVRVHSKKARKKMNEEGLKIKSRFDTLDTLETREDIEMLFETLQSVQDKHGNPAVFTPFAIPCNINFEKMAETGYTEYFFELLPDTFRKLSEMNPDAYKGAWRLIKEGIDQGLMVPQFHGREHFNLKVFKEKLRDNDHTVLTALKNRSYTSISGSGYDSISTLAAFNFHEFHENEQLQKIIEDGIRAFEDVYGYKPENFMAPGGREHPVLHETLLDCGIRYLDTPLVKSEHQGEGKYKRVFNYTGKQNELGQIFLVRNVLFEPSENESIDWADYAMNQIEAAFRWNRPAIISSHRVNFCGLIDPDNRSRGIASLEKLLNRIVSRWPEVEFMSASSLGRLIENNL